MHLLQNKIFVAFLLMMLPLLSSAQVPFHKGVNLSGWFQAKSSQAIKFSKFTKADIQNIKSLGCDVIRLPINLHDMTSHAPDYTLDTLLLNYLNQVIDWCEGLNMHLILDNHSFDPSKQTDPAIGQVLNKVWIQMAHEFKTRSKYIYYEVLNEPHGIDDVVWGKIQQTVIETIRTEDTTHFIIVGAANWNHYKNLKNIPQYEDDKLIYTFHFYDPFMFTHQGAKWTTPSLVPVSGISFPYRKGSMPVMPPSLKDTWAEKSFSKYEKEATPEGVKRRINIAAKFSKSRNVPVYCGEFGVYIPNTNNDDRVEWYKLVVGYLNKKNIPWTMWDYKGTFGLFNKDSQESFERDLNLPLIEAMKLNVPK